LRDKLVLIKQATHIKNESTIMDAPYDRYRQCPKRSRKSLQRCALA
jgi:hypothetical protein